jgi:hypothetical protein
MMQQPTITTVQNFYPSYEISLNRLQTWLESRFPNETITIEVSASFLDLSNAILTVHQGRRGQMAFQLVQRIDSGM